MSRYEQQFKPTIKPTLRPGAAVLATLLFFLWAGGIRGALGMTGFLVSVAVVAVPFAFWLVRTLISRPATERVCGRELRLASGQLRQFDSANQIVAEIDVTKPFQYRILDRYDIEDSLFCLYQGDVTLQFYNSDPGGADVVRDVIQIRWPPRSRHIGRSYPPTPP